MAPDRLTSPTDTEVRSARRYREHRVPRGAHHLYAREYPGAEPALVLLHGFPDDSRIYDRLAPLLAPRRAVAVDWLGYGRSDRVQPDPSDDAAHQQQLRAVLDALRLDRVVLVGHDAGGPDAIDYALGEPGRVAQRRPPCPRAVRLRPGSPGPHRPSSRPRTSMSCQPTGGSL